MCPVTGKAHTQTHTFFACENKFWPTSWAHTTSNGNTTKRNVGMNEKTKNLILYEHTHTNARTPRICMPVCVWKIVRPTLAVCEYNIARMPRVCTFAPMLVVYVERALPLCERTHSIISFLVNVLLCRMFRRCRAVCLFFFLARTVYANETLSRCSITV